MDRKLIAEEDQSWATFLEVQREWVELDEAFWAQRPTRGAAYMNRLVRRAGALKARLRTSPTWPHRVEMLLHDASPGIRLEGALELARWDIRRALQILDEISRVSEKGAQRGATYAAERLRNELAASQLVAAQPPEHMGNSQAIHGHPIEAGEEAIALAEAVLTVHGAVMGGGVEALRDLDAATIARALEGFEAIGLGEVAQLLREAPALAAPPRPQPTGSVGPASDLQDTSVALDARYDSLVPDDSHLGDLIDRFLDARGT